MPKPSSSHQNKLLEQNTCSIDSLRVNLLTVRGDLTSMATPCLNDLQVFTNKCIYMQTFIGYTNISILLYWQCQY